MSLKVYTVHLRQPARDAERDLVIVREGFSWGAFLVSVLWALWNRLWLVAIVLMALELVLPLVPAGPGSALPAAASSRSRSPCWRGCSATI